ncbi:MAG: hypothetical protein WCF31_00010 [Candidatus Deferrimicrobiaceae bacterium]
MQRGSVFPGLLGLAMLAALAALACGGGLTLKECLQVALASNPSFKESRLAVSASERSVESAEGHRYSCAIVSLDEPGRPKGGESTERRKHE